MRVGQIQMGIWTHNLITEDQIVPTKTIQLSG